MTQEALKDSGWTEGVKERQQENSGHHHLKTTSIKIKSVKMSIDSKNTKLSTGKATPKETSTVPRIIIQKSWK